MTTNKMKEEGRGLKMVHEVRQRLLPQTIYNMKI